MSGAREDVYENWLAWNGSDDDALLAPLAFDLHVDYDQRRLTAFGELDAMSAHTLVHAITTLLRHNPGDSTVDLAHLTFIDAGGLSGLVHINQQVVAAGGTLAVVGSSVRIRDTFGVAGLDSLLAAE
jgi:anti-anti-sigma factor